MWAEHARVVRGPERGLKIRLLHCKPFTRNLQVRGSGYSHCVHLFEASELTMMAARPLRIPVAEARRNSPRVDPIDRSLFKNLCMHSLSFSSGWVPSSLVLLFPKWVVGVKSQAPQLENDLRCRPGCPGKFRHLASSCGWFK